MRSEDRKPSKRVFPLLQNLDLDTVTFAQIASTGDPISIEDMNEQEMLDLIIVNLARLCVKSEWTGLLEAGGGGGFSEVLPNLGSTDGDQYDISFAPPWNGTVVTSQNVSGLTKPHSFPFIAPATGTVSAIGIYVASASAGDDIYVGIYSQDTNFLPSTRLGYATISLGSTGSIYQTSLTGTVSLTAGTQYWFSVGLAQSSTATLRAGHDAYLPALGLTDTLDSKHFAIEDDSESTFQVPPATFTPNLLDGTQPRYGIGLKF